MSAMALFPDFSGFWVPLAPVADLRAGQPLGLVLAGTRVVLFRDSQGVARALLDVCPHRGVALSLGKVVAGELECPFHGWRFDGAGQCRHVPWNPEAKRGNLGATALPLREIGGVFWLFTGLEPVGESVVPEALLRGDIRLTAQTFVWDVHWTRVMENMLDSPHLPFVHAKTIGRGMIGLSDRPMVMEWRENETGAAIWAQREGEAARNNLDYIFPNMMMLTIDPPKKFFRMLAVCAPEAEGRCRLTIYTLRDFAKGRLFDPIFAWSNRRIAAEDHRIIESSWPSEVPEAGAEKSVASDAPTLAFRKIWFSRIKDSHLGARA